MSLLVGGNNSGKTSLLHSLVVWEFCKTVLVYEKGNESLLQGFKGKGQGVSLDEFTPINIPSFKYLWTGVSPKSGYTLTIKCFWDNEANIEKFLSIGLAYNQERLLIKNVESNLQNGDIVPHIAYLPTFAGVVSKEQWYSGAFRNKLIGQGLAGAVIRNEVMELYNNNIKLRKEKKDGRPKIKDSDLLWIRKNDPYELLNQTLGDVFDINLFPSKFDPEFHTHVEILLKKGKQIGLGRFNADKKFHARDFMVEGSGFLQWLSVYTFALSPSIDILLLDEPDAHLHCSLQTELFKHLSKIAKQKSKQTLVATHSSEVIKSFPPTSIMYVNSGKSSYLTKEEQKCVVLNSIGTEYFPLLEELQRKKKILFVENESDATLLKKFCEKMGLDWPEITVWPSATKHKERKQFFLQLKDKIKPLKAISINDRDNESYNKTHQDLKFGAEKDLVEKDNELRYRTWRRWEMESYLLCPDAMSRLLHKKDPTKTIEQYKSDILDYMKINMSRIFPDDYLKSEMTQTNQWMFESDAKTILSPICREFKIDKYQIAEEMNDDEIFEDIKTLIAEIGSL